MTDRGPIYGVKLLDSLPVTGKMRQALPCRRDLERVREVSERTVAGYEVLCEHYQRLQSALAYIAVDGTADDTPAQFARDALDYPATSELWELALRGQDDEEEDDGK